jgi:two-component system, sensor histidine kinase and response regulator
MLDNLLVWANLQLKNTKPAITTVNLDDCIADALAASKVQAEQKNIVFEKNIEISTAYGEYTILEIALRNITNNAVKFSPAHSTITISTKKDAEHTYIVVKDNGVGMTTQQVQALMHNDTESTMGTDGEKGSGLGFFLVKELLQKINGTVLIETAEGKGTSITIQLEN